MKKKKDEPETQDRIAVFQKKEIRKTFFDSEWWFVINDIVEFLTDSKDPGQYFKRLKQRDKELAALLNKGGVQFVPPLMLEFDTRGGKQKMYCWNTEGIFRLIQSIPSPKAEPFKRWLAKTGYERVQEIENPELAINRMRVIYNSKGYSDEWIENRLRSIKVRKELTDEWQDRGVDTTREYSILTAEISKAAFGMTPDQYKEYKGLDKPTENLRDHMTDLELIFTMLGEASTVEIARKKDTRGFISNKKASREGGAVAGSARNDLEKRSGHKVSTSINYKELPEKKVRRVIKK